MQKSVFFIFFGDCFMGNNLFMQQRQNCKLKIPSTALWAVNLQQVAHCGEIWKMLRDFGKKFKTALKWLPPFSTCFFPMSHFIFKLSSQCATCFQVKWRNFFVNSILLFVEIQIEVNDHLLEWAVILICSSQYAGKSSCSQINFLNGQIARFNCAFVLAGLVLTETDCMIY